jgi:hypothetical protein
LHVVHRDHDRALPCERAQRREERGGHGARIRGLAARTREQERHGQGVALGLREHGEEVVERIPEQVRDRREGQRHLGLARPCRQNPSRGGRRCGQAGLPDRRLADPGFPLDQQDPRTRPQSADQTPELLELVIAADDHISILGPFCAEGGACCAQLALALAPGHSLCLLHTSRAKVRDSRR